MTFSSYQTFHHWISNVASDLLMVRNEFLTDEVFFQLKTLMEFKMPSLQIKGKLPLLLELFLLVFQSMSSDRGFSVITQSRSLEFSINVDLRNLYA